MGGGGEILWEKNEDVNNDSGGKLDTPPERDKGSFFKRFFRLSRYTVRGDFEKLNFSVRNLPRLIVKPFRISH